MSEDNVVDLNTAILINIRDELVGVREEVASVREEVASVREEVASVRAEVAGVRVGLQTLEVETIRGFTAVRNELSAVNQRLDNVIAIAGAGHRDHEGRIAALESAVSTLRPSRPRARR